jgi:ATP-dependent Clp protease ATP-binding subunit ClpC
MIESMDENEKEQDVRKKSGGTPVLDNFSRDLNKLASEGKLDPVIGRDVEITRIAQILSRRKKNNAIIIGEPGAGKTSIVEGLAIQIYEGKCPRNLRDKRIVNLDLTSIVAGTKYRGQFEERMKAIIEEIADNPDVIIFIDEIHTMVGAGNSSGAMDASNIFKPALSRGEIHCIGATTFDEYRQNIEKDGALERRFQKVVVDPPSKTETLQIIKQSKSRYEDFHKVTYSDEVLELCVNLADRYITDREFPDKAFDILDEVGSKSQIDIKAPPIIENLKNKAAEIKKQKLDVVKKQDYEKAADLRDAEKKVLDKLEVEKNKFEQELLMNKRPIDIDVVLDVVSNMTKIPLNRLTLDDKNNLSNLENDLSKKVIGQNEAITKISKSIRRNRLKFKDPNKPIGSYIFLGGTGTGKTHLAKQLAEQIFGSPDALIRVDMSEYQEKHNVSRLIGAPPGYVGYDQGGQLTEQVKAKPYSLVLFDEIEKANKDIFHTLLQMLDEGHITDGLGRKISFKNCLIIMTSNIGIKKIQDFGTGIGFTTSRYAEEEKKKTILQSEMKKYFQPEFLNRIDDVIVFNSLSKEDVKEIVKIEVGKLTSRLKGLKININCQDSVIEHIGEIGFDETYGARPIKRAIQEKIEDLVSEKYLSGDIVEGKNYYLTYKDDEIKISTKKGT